MENVKKEIVQNLQSKKVLVGCSTGVDSMTLLTLVKDLLPSEQIIVCHVNHQKRKASEEEEQYMKEYCQENNLTLEIMHLPKTHKGNFQEWARNERYLFYEQIAIKYQIDVILLGHHADDNIETILMRLIKTSSLKGYAGIAKWGKYHDFLIYRPFLNLPKVEIVNYANANKVTYFEDESNEHDDYTRNRIRHHVMPILLEENPNLYQAIENYQSTLLSVNNLLEKVKVAFIENKVSVNNNDNEMKIVFQINDFLELEEDLQIPVLFRILKPFHLSKLCINNIIKQIKTSKTPIISQINKKLGMIKEYNQVTFTTLPINKLSFYLKIEKEGLYQLPNNQILEVSKNICNFKASKLSLWYNIDNLPIIVRTRQEGDQLVFNYGTKTLSNYLTDQKMPYLQRKDLLLLCDGEGNIKSILGYILKK